MDFSSGIRANKLVGARGFEPPPPCTPKHLVGVPGSANECKPVDSLQRSPAAPSQPFQAFAPVTKTFAAHLLPSTLSSKSLLSVAAVAQHLAVSTARVYALVAECRLPHVRISNSIRVDPADLAEFIAHS